MRYVFVIGNDNVENSIESDDKDMLIQSCKHEWAHLSYYDRKRQHAYVLESVNPDEDAMDHMDGTIIFDAKKWEEEELAND